MKTMRTFWLNRRKQILINRRIKRVRVPKEKRARIRRMTLLIKN